LCAGEFSPLSPPLEVRPFALTERSGNTLSRDDLRGKVWIAHFFYPTCQGPCTKTVPVMRQVQEAVAGKPDIVLVSIALAGDEPALLRRFAHDQQADPAQWLFLTEPGKVDDVLELVQQSFFQPAVRKPDGKPGDEIDHTTKLLVIDRHGMMRGYIDGTDPANVPALVAKVRQVAAERYWLPAQNGVLNSLSTVLLVVGWLAIKRRYEKLHTACMVAALITSAAFLAGYLYFHFAVLDGQPTRFRGEGWVRPVYFAILLSHTILAAVVAPLALYVAYQGWRDRRPRHVRLARWTLPIWLYVSVTGVVIYVMLYQL
jgi:protein SCO1/2/putative membrane protein